MRRKLEYLLVVLIIFGMMLQVTSCISASEPEMLSMAEDYCKALCELDYQEISDLSYELSKKDDKELAELMDLEDESNYSEDQASVFEKIKDTMTFEIDDDSLEIGKKEATVDVSFSMIDYKTIFDLGIENQEDIISFIDEYNGTIEETITLELALIRTDCLVNTSMKSIKTVLGFLSEEMDSSAIEGATWNGYDQLGQDNIPIYYYGCSEMSVTLDLNTDNIDDLSSEIFYDITSEDFECRYSSEMGDVTAVIDNEKFGITYDNLDCKLYMVSFYLSNGYEIYTTGARVVDINEDLVDPVDPIEPVDPVEPETPESPAGNYSGDANSVEWETAEYVSDDGMVVIDEECSSIQGYFVSPHDPENMYYEISLNDTVIYSSEIGQVDVLYGEEQGATMEDGLLVPGIYYVSFYNYSDDTLYFITELHINVTYNEVTSGIDDVSFEDNPSKEPFSELVEGSIYLLDVDNGVYETDSILLGFNLILSEEANDVYYYTVAFITLEDFQTLADDESITSVADFFSSDYLEYYETKEASDNQGIYNFGYVPSDSLEEGLYIYFIHDEYELTEDSFIADSCLFVSDEYYYSDK